MSRDIGKKKKDREKVVREKMIRRRAKLIEVRKEDRKKELLDRATRRRQEPIVRHRLGGDTSVPMSQERDIEINEENLRDNLAKLKAMEQEFIDVEKAREEYKEKLNNVGELTQPVGHCDGADEAAEAGDAGGADTAADDQG